MIYVKTQAGQQALKERHVSLPPRQRSAFILFDGKRTVAQVLEATASMGITAQDVQDTITAEAKGDLFANVQKVVSGQMTAAEAVESAMKLN